MSAWAVVQWGLLVLAVPACGYILRAWRRGRAQFAFGLVLLFGYAWAFGQHLLNCVGLYWPDEAAYRAALNICYFGMCGLGPSSVYLAWCYAGRWRLYRNRAVVGMLFGLGLFFYLSVLTTDLHHLYYTHFSMEDRGYSVLFYLFTVFSYGCFIYAYLIMQWAKLGVGDRTNLLMLLCFGPPVAANTAEMILGDPRLDFTPLAYCVMIAGACLIIWWQRPVRLEPLAARRVFDEMPGPVRVTGPDGARLYSNPAGAGELPAGRHYHTARTPLPDGNTMHLYTDITDQELAQELLEEQRRHLHATREVLAQQAQELEARAGDAARLAAEQRRLEIMGRLDAVTRGKLEALRQNTEHLIEAPDPGGIARGRRLAGETLETVRSIVDEMRRRPGDGL
ncbi:hypothetical protein LJC64_01020 [Ruminococcaceae bacterium OttesenSCG-928-A11]|nr:hypothetical protein [Ruminococcaceae bacterium OttesenSCG-928-A11]